MESTRAITEMILQEAQKSAEVIIQEAKKTAEDSLTKQRKLGVQRATEEAQSLSKKAQRESEINKLRSMANAKTKANWFILSKKEKIIDNVIEAVENKILTLTESNEYRFILEKLIKDGGVILGGSDLEVLLNEKDSTLPLKLDKLAKEISEKTGVKTRLRLLEEKIEVIGGAMVRRINGEVILDNTFDDILRRRERDLRSEIAKILF